MDFFRKFGIKPGQAICYSGFREGQQPVGNYPSYSQIKEDLLLLSQNWNYIRIYDCDDHGKMVLNVIKLENIPIRVMLGAYIEAEMNNFGCPWGGGVYSEEQLEANKEGNRSKINALIQLSQAYEKEIFSLSVGNEACVDWTDHYVPVASILNYVKMVKNSAKHPVTYCENYVPWLFHLNELAEELDFISIHTYPVWEYKHIHEALEYTKANYNPVKMRFPKKAVVITEAGWSTYSNGRGINPEMVNETNQKTYVGELLQLSKDENILSFVFEAFDEDWKGSHDPLEPEKHWGLYKIDRTPKEVMTHFSPSHQKLPYS